MYKIFIYWLVKAPLGVLKVLLCIYSVFGFFSGLIWPILLMTTW